MCMIQEQWAENCLRHQEIKARCFFFFQEYKHLGNPERQISAIFTAEAFKFF